MILGLAFVGIVVLGFGGFGVYLLVTSGLHKGPDHMFGDQHLKTTVALLELHRVRNGSYPAALRDIQYTGDWDKLPLTSVKYCPSPDRKTYYVEVTRGWVGKPKLAMPPDFWRGTGYRASGIKDCP